MTDLKGLDPETRCFALVGQFLQAWSTMEKALHRAIGAALNIEAERLLILTANMRLRDKTNILRTLVDVAPRFDEQQKAKDKNILKNIAEYAAVRNMIAHDPFGPDETKKSVAFFTVKAKGKYALPDVVWSSQDFEQAGKQLEEYRQALSTIAENFESKPLSQKDYESVSIPFTQSDWSVPMRRTMSPALADLLSRPVPVTDKGILEANWKQGEKCLDEARKRWKR